MYGTQSAPWGEYGRTNFYTPPPQTYASLANVLGLDSRTLGANLRHLYDPMDSPLYQNAESAINSYYNNAQNDYLRYINQLMGTNNNTPTTVADVLRQRGGGSLETGTANQITDLAALESAGAQSAIEKALASFIPSQKAALRARSGATRSLSDPDWGDQSVRAAWAPLVANAASGQYANSSNTARQQVANVAQGNNDLLRQFATYGAQNAANFSLERARALAGLRTAGLGYLGSIGNSLMQGAMNAQTTPVQSFPRGGTTMLGTMTNPTGGFSPLSGSSPSTATNTTNHGTPTTATTAQGTAGRGTTAEFINSVFNQQNPYSGGWNTGVSDTSR